MFRSTFVIFLLLAPGPLVAQEPQESQFVKLLKSGRVPEERVGTILDLIGKRGSTADLTFLFERVRVPEGFGPSGRQLALAALAEAAITRQARPDGDLSGVVPLIRGEGGADEPIRMAATRLAGVWRLEAAGAELRKLAESSETPGALRAVAVDSLAEIGGEAGVEALARLAAPEQPWEVRALGAAALSRIDLDAALPLAIEILAQPPAEADLAPLLAAFLNRQGAADRLAEAIERRGLEPDPAKLALRAMYAQGRTDPTLVAALSQAAGLDAEPEPLDEAAMRSLLAEIDEKGNPARGERIFRRPDLNCVQCHALAGAGGGIGPELSAIGVSSPHDYLIDSILLPDQAIKEEYQTLVVFTDDGQVFQGLVADRDDRRIVLREAAGGIRTIPTSSIEETKEGGSLMPKGLANLMTRQELIDLVRFLGELGKPGPYAIRTVPTIQRWRVLREPDDEALVQKAPNPETLRSMVLEAADDRWAPVYAFVSGDLPLDEAVRLSGGPIVYLIGEIDVTVPGQIQFRLDAPEGVRVWINGEPADGVADFSHNFTAAGRQAVILRVDTEQRSYPTLRLEAERKGGTIVQFTVVGGR